MIGREEEELVLEVLRRKALFRYYGPDPKAPPEMVATLEREATALLGVRFALGVTSGSAALEVALGALGVGPGDEVILPAWSWVSCFTSIVRVGAKPVLAEIDETLCLAPGEITRLRTPRASRCSRIVRRARGRSTAVAASAPSATSRSSAFSSRKRSPVARAAWW
jgi:8-amino-3,8-dideoxy-alpha-D-manno-octulosonate transaminase